MDNESEYEIVMKRVLRGLGFVLLIISIYFSYDGFDQEVGGGNSRYTLLGKVIAILLAVTFSGVQFILNSKPDKLNATLVTMGVLAYCYSMYTNYLGSIHILGMTQAMAAVLAFAMDVIPEPLIAWSFGDSLKGDLIGNMGKVAGKVTRTALGLGERKTQPKSPTFQPMKMPQNQPQNRPQGGFKPKFDPNQTRPRSDGVRPEFQNKIKHR